MKKAINVEKDYFGLTLNEQIACAKKIGFDAVFFDWVDNESFFETANFAKANEMEIASIHAPFGDVCDIWEEESPEFLNTLKKCVTDCAKIGTKTIVCHVHIGFDNEPSVTEYGIKNFNELLDLAEKQGINIAFENTEGLERLYGIKEHLENRARCGFCIDTGHELCYNGGKDLLKDFGNKLFFLHINDNLGQTLPSPFWHDDAHMVPFKEGKVDWNRFTENLKRLNFDGYLSFEMCISNKPDRHTHDDLIGITCEYFHKQVYDAAVRLENMIRQ